MQKCFFRSLLAALILIFTACTQQAPRLNVEASLSLAGSVGNAVTQTLTVTNAGGGTLNYLVRTSASWLTLSASEGSIGAGASNQLSLTTLCSEATPAVEVSKLYITSNDPLGSVKTVEIRRSCSPDAFDISLKFIGSDFSLDRQQVFQAAAARWTRAFTQGLPDVTLVQDIPANGSCGFGEPTVSGKIDDLLIFAVIREIDGPGNILGGAYPSFVRSSDGLTYIGCMIFDKADVATQESKGSFSRVVLHELGHVLGFGSLWTAQTGTSSPELMRFSGDNSVCRSASSFLEPPTFTGLNALAEYVQLGGTGNVPLEDKGGSGTQCSHWDEETFGDELMTGFAGPGTTLPLSRLTLASLADLGYKVDLTAADAYTPPACFPDNCIRSQKLQEPWELLGFPKGSISPEGEITFF